ncbi:threonine synthase [Halomicrobium salinisoli]|uniref:threonine synthase n=1 Tax=Halomicrobium salinisoli TaxID=2878391 RepID=UPI001CF00254|nr:pyridoxal-phosphate dependent enzyme [Halomicrobium salinisoli]
MDATTAFRGLECLDCGATAPDGSYRCPDCGGLLRASYDLDAVPGADALDGRDPGPYRVAELLPFSRDHAVTMDEGATPATACPTLADEFGVDELLVKDEGRNPTGAATDRGLSLAVTAARDGDAAAVALPTTGNGGQSAAAHAGRAGLDSHSFVPSRCPFVNKAMINVHGGDMNVVEGRYPDAVEAYEGGREDEWTPVGPASPYRREGLKGIYFEVAATLSWSAPDALVVPTGHGTALAAIHAAATQLADAGVVDETPRLYAAQPTGCAPVVDAVADGEVSPEEQPDSIVGSLEVPDPVLGDRAAAAVRESDGEGVAVDDDDALAAAVDAAGDTGLEVSATGGVGVAAARKLADLGAFDGDDAVVVVNPVAGGKENDVLRSHLMSRGV